MKYVVIILVILVVLGTGGWFLMARMKAANAASNAAPNTDVVARRTIEKLVSANGKVASNRDVDIKCQASGTIMTLPYTDVSQEVKPGEIVCQLDPKDEEPILVTAKAVVDADQARLKESQMNWKIAQMSLITTHQRNQAALDSAVAQAADAHGKAARTQQLYEAKPTALASKEELDTANTTAAQLDAAVENARAAIAEEDQLKISVDTKEQQITETQSALSQDQARLKTAQQNYEYCTVTAPLLAKGEESDPPRWFISSLLTNIAPGYIVQSGTSGFSAGTTIMTLSDLSHVYVLASVDESDIGQVIDPMRGGEKQKVRTTVDSFPGQVFEGEVVRVATKGVNVSNVVTFEVKIEITSPNRTLLRPEMTTTSNIICASRTNVLAVPAADFSRTGGGDKSGGGDTAAAPGSAPADPATAATGTAPATTRRGRGNGRGAGSPAGASPLNMRQNGIVSLPAAGGTTETRNVVVGLMGNDPDDTGAGDLYEIISGLGENDAVIHQTGQDSRFRNNGVGQLMRGIGGGGRGR